MSILPDPKDVLLESTGYKDLDKLSYDRMESEEVIAAMKEYGRQVRDRVLEWAAKEAQLGIFYRSGASVDGSNDTLQHTREEVILDDCGWSKSIAKVDREGILDGKHSKDLLI